MSLCVCIGYRQSIYMTPFILELRKCILTLQFFIINYLVAYLLANSDDVKTINHKHNMNSNKKQDIVIYMGTL